MNLLKKMEIHIIVLLTSLAARTWAENFQPILSQISAGDNECNKKDLLGGFDLKTVPEFNALCNLPTPNFKQSEFLLENNVVPVLCMGLMDASLRLCETAKDDLASFNDVFPPSAEKFNGIFDTLNKSSNFSSLDIFCSTTVNNLIIKEAASNVTNLWWKLLNDHLSDKSLCTDICRSHEKNKVHPLCSFIFWANGLCINHQKNKLIEKAPSSTDEEQKPSVVEKVAEPVSNKETQSSQDIAFVKNQMSTNSTEAGLQSASLPKEKQKTVEVIQSNLTTDNSVGVGTAEQVMNNSEYPSITNVVRVNNSAVLGKPGKKWGFPVNKKYKTKITDFASTPNKNLNTATSNINLENQVPPANSDLKPEAKVDSKVNAATVSWNVPDAGSPVATDTKQPLPAAPAVVGEGMVEGDVSVEVTPPDGTGGDGQYGTAGKDLPPPPYSDEEGDDGDGDGDDVDIVESPNQLNTNPAVNNSKLPTSNTGVSDVQQSALEGDKVYGDGEILIEDHFIEAEDSHFFTYFLCMAVLTIMAYLVFHNKKKLIALAVEGRRAKGGRRRPNSSHYSKLDCSLEEALVSNSTASVTHVLY